MNVTIYGYEINVETVICCAVLYVIIVFNILYSTVRLQGFKELYELLGIGIEEGFEVLTETAQKLKQKKYEQSANKVKKIVDTTTKANTNKRG